jgi:hypothetical protein
VVPIITQKVDDGYKRVFHEILVMMGGGIEQFMVRKKTTQLELFLRIRQEVTIWW